MSTEVKPRSVDETSGLLERGEGNVTSLTHVADEKPIENFQAKVGYGIRASIAANVFLLIVKIYVVIASDSLAVMASVVDSCVDLLSQIIILYTEKAMELPPDINYPEGRSRLEPVGVMFCALVMSMASLEVIQASATSLYRTLSGKSGAEEVTMSAISLGIVSFAILSKIGLYWYCERLSKYSSSIQAVAEDHRNDILSNLVAITASGLTSYNPLLWWVDAVGAILISIFIICSWWSLGMEQVDFLIGKAASDDFIAHIREVCAIHHPTLKLDIIRAYHFGRNYLVELEVILPRDYTVVQAHDIALALQQKVEMEANVERAFVHVDYQSRDYNEHKDPRSKEPNKNQWS